MKKLAMGLLFALITSPHHSWSMQHKKDARKLPAKLRLQAAKNRKSQLLLKAAQEGELELLKNLANQADLNFHAPENDASPLMVACEAGRLNIVKFLLQKLTKKEINERRGCGSVSVTPVWLASQNKRTGCAQALVAAGADVSIPDPEGYLPIHLAADGADLNLLCCLLQASPQTANAQNAHGVTPLHKAVCKNNLDAAALLLTHGANPTLPDAHGLSAFDYAAECADKKMRELLGRHAPADQSPQKVETEDLALTRIAWVCQPADLSAAVQLPD